MGGYSAEFDVSPAAKIHQGGSHLQRWADHVGRDLDDRNGQPKAHSNKQIDRSRTLNNNTFVFDEAKGRLVRADSVEQMVKAIQARVDLHGGKTPSGKSARALTDTSVIVRPMILGLDEQWWQEHCPDWKTNGLNDEAQRMIKAQIKWAQDTFGAQNLPAVSLHMDEHKPSLQLAFVPMNDHGQISQKSYFPNGQAMSALHDSYRQALRAAGYDATRERVTGERSKIRFTEKTFKREMAKVAERAAELDELELKLNTRKKDLDVRERDLDDEVERRAAERVKELKAAALEQARAARLSALASDKLVALINEGELRLQPGYDVGVKSARQVERTARERLVAQLAQEEAAELRPPAKPATDRDLTD